MYATLQNPKVVGSFVIGFALVGLSYVASNFGATRAQPVGELSVAQAQAPARVFIEVTDRDGNGIEDWREEFVIQRPIILPDEESTAPAEFTPTTLTEQLSVAYFESFIRGRSQGPIGPSQEELAVQTVERVEGAVRDRLYTGQDVVVIPETPAAIRTYGNTMGQILINNNVPGYEDELTIIDRALRLESQAELDKLVPLANMYLNLRDQSLRTPVPESLLKEHLDLINVYHALYLSLSDLQKSLEDPVVALLRIKRYQDDATGLLLAMQNMYFKLMPYASLFTVNDPVTVFLVFAPR